MTAPFRDGQSLSWERYPACEPEGWMQWVRVFDARVHRQLDALLREAPGAMDAHEFAAFYERIMAPSPNTAVMLDLLAACGIFIVG